MIGGAMNETEPKMRVVTPEQYRQGYLEKIGDQVIDRDFTLIRKLPDGNYLVHEPTLSARPLFAERR